MQGRKGKLLRYSLVGYVAGSRLITSAGQTMFSTNLVTKYFLRSDKSPARYPITALAVTAGLVANSLTRIPAIYKKYGIAKSTHDLQEENDIQFKHTHTRITYYVLLTACIIAAELNDPLGAYLGSVVMLEKLGSLIGLEVDANLWSKIVAQISSLVFGAALALNNNAYDLQFLKHNARELCHYLDKKIITCNKSMYETLLFSFPVCVAAPVLTYFFNKPALLKIPGAHLILRETGLAIVTAIMATAAFIRGIVSLPSIYNTMYQFNEPHQPNTEQRSDPCNAKVIRITGYSWGTVDAMFGGLCVLVSIVTVAAQFLHLSDAEMYNWILILVASIFAISLTVQGILFGLKPGLEQTIKDLNSETKESLPLLVSENAGVKLYGTNRAVGLLFGRSNSKDEQPDISAEKTDAVLKV